MVSQKSCGARFSRNNEAATLATRDRRRFERRVFRPLAIRDRRWSKQRVAASRRKCGANNFVPRLRLILEAVALLRWRFGKDGR
jgi:hypothetical protein